MLDIVESYYILFTRWIRERPHQEGISEKDYRRLIKQIRKWCDEELRNGETYN